MRILSFRREWRRGSIFYARPDPYAQELNYSYHGFGAPLGGIGRRTIADLEEETMFPMDMFIVDLVTHQL